MTNKETTLTCFNCDRSEVEIPLVSLRYAGSEKWVCSQCLPVLIHHPDRIAGKLSPGKEAGAG